MLATLRCHTIRHTFGVFDEGLLQLQGELPAIPVATCNYQTDDFANHTEHSLRECLSLQFT